MARQYRCFWGIAFTAFALAIILTIYPFSQPSFSVSPSDSTTQSSSYGLWAQQSELETSPLPLFEDPGQQYSIALLDGFKPYSVSGKSILESFDGNVAYSVIVAPTLLEPSALLTDAALAQMAQVIFQQGEGFIAKNFQSLDQGGIKINWTGQITVRKAQPLSGTIFAQQFGKEVFLLMIAATEEGQDALTQAIAILPSSLRPLTQ